MSSTSPSVVVAWSSVQTAGFPHLLDQLRNAGFLVVSSHGPCGCAQDMEPVPDAALVNCTDGSDLHALSALRLAPTPVAPICYSETADGAHARMLLGLGAIAVLRPGDGPGRLIDAIRLARAVTQELRASVRQEESPPSPAAWVDPFVRDHELTATEARVLERYCVLGDQTETAAALDTKVRSIRFHLEQIAQKCGCDKQKQLLPHVIRWMSEFYGSEAPPVSEPARVFELPRPRTEEVVFSRAEGRA